jgi:hypothetical protein
VGQRRAAQHQRPDRVPAPPGPRRCRAATRPGRAGGRIVGGIVLVGAAVLTLGFGGTDAKTYWWTAFWLVLAVLNLTVGYQGVLVAHHQAAARA